MTKFVKNFLIFIILCFFFSGKAHAADCNQASGDITGTEGSPDTTLYVCEDNDAALNARGLSKAELKIFKSAIADFKKAILINPKNKLT